jgi:hypothetical protein
MLLILEAPKDVDLGSACAGEKSPFLAWNTAGLFLLFQMIKASSNQPHSELALKLVHRQSRDVTVEPCYKNPLGKNT